jgi:sterol desaturase/sphingolipid hydroxylase (fatty acid hydroxylase superfamily)
MMEGLWPVAFPGVLFLLLFLLERWIPLRRERHTLGARLLVNAGVSMLALATATFVVRPVANGMLERGNEESLGILRLVEWSGPVEFILAFLLMDLTFYWWHRANHLFPFLWRFHNTHHIDPEVDVSTAFRFHFVEVALSAGFRVLQISVTGVSAWTYAIYDVVFTCGNVFHHSNLRLPIGFERVLSKILVTPRMHGIHHSQVKEENRSNFSVVFPWWDWLHRTLRLNIPQSQVAIGIAGYSAPNDNTLWQAHALPFERQRDYWRDAEGKEVERDPAVCGPQRTRLEA